MRYGSDFDTTTNFGSDIEADSNSSMNSEPYWKVIREREEYVQEIIEFVEKLDIEDKEESEVGDILKNKPKMKLLPSTPAANFNKSSSKKRKSFKIKVGLEKSTK